MVMIYVWDKEDGWNIASLPAGFAFAMADITDWSVCLPSECVWIVPGTLGGQNR